MLTKFKIALSMFKNSPENVFFSRAMVYFIY